MGLFTRNNRNLELLSAILEYMWAANHVSITYMSIIYILGRGMVVILSIWPTAGVMADMQMGWELLAALIDANSYVIYTAVYFTSYMYICALCT